MAELRSPIICVLGHVDHGKTSLLDAIRDTSVASKEAGAITQMIHAYEVSADAVKAICGPMLEKMKVNLSIPGLLFIDTPGHEAFVNLRKRGGSIADIAILVIDINQGIQNQTKEAIEILKEYKTPFVVAATKIDVTSGWRPNPGASFMETNAKQRKDVQDEVDKKVYELVGALSYHGFAVERFDRVGDFTKSISIIPVSAKTGEGLPELLLFVSGLAQRYLEKQLESKAENAAKASILEVKELKGSGKTLDAIIYEGTLRQGDSIIFAGPSGEVVKTRVRALLKADGSSLKEVKAAAGVKIACDGAERGLAGSSLFAVNHENEAEATDELRREIQEIEIENTGQGVIVKAEALGSLEAIVKIFTAEGIAIRRASIGNVTKRDMAEAASVASQDKFLGTVFAFNISVEQEMVHSAELAGVHVVKENVIYNLVTNYKHWVDTVRAKEKKEAFSKLVLPAKLKVLPGFCFRASNPAIFGVEVTAGRIRKDYRMMDSEGKIIGTVTGIQKEKEGVDEAKRGDQLAISMPEPFYGRQVRENQDLISYMTPSEIFALEDNYKQSLSEDEKDLLEEIKKITGVKRGFNTG